METRICNKCKIEKSINDFYFRKGQNKYNTICKKCCNERAMNRYNKKKDEISKYNKLYYQKNKEKLIEQNKNNYNKNKEHKKQISKEYYYENKEQYKKRAKEYRKRNYDILAKKQHQRYLIDKENILLKQKQYYQKHKEERQNYWKEYRAKKENKEKINNYIKHKKENDKLFLYTNRIRRLIKISISKMGYTKKSKTYKILGADFKTVFNHLLQTYKYNYDVDYDFKEKVHIDHIIPISTAKNENDINKLNHYTNLQLLKEKDNLEKGNKLNWKIKEEKEL